MIDLGRPPLSIDGVWVFDAVGERTKYFLPPPVLARSAEGRPDVSLARSRSPVGESSTTLRLVTTLQPDRALLDRARQQLGRGSTGPITVAPMPVESTRAGLWLAAADGPQVAWIDAFPDQSSPHQAVFTQRLTAPGAALIEDGLRAGTLTGLVIYWLQTAATQPAVPARITIDRDAVARFFAELGGEARLPATAIVGAARQLAEIGAIRVELTADPKDQSALQRVDAAIERLLLTEVFGAISTRVDRTTLARIDQDVSATELAVETQLFEVRSADSGGRATFDLSAASEQAVTVAVASSLSRLLQPVRADLATGAFVTASDEAPA